MPCLFCDIVKHQKKVDFEGETNSSTHIPLYNRKIAESRNFLVIPGVGSITEGYLQIITKDHFNSMAELSADKIVELNDIVNEIARTIESLYDIAPVAFEHGSPSQNMEDVSQSTIRHAHIHLVPFRFKSHEQIVAHSGMTPIDSIFDLIKYRGCSYVYYMDNGKKHHVTVNRELPSQYMRRWWAADSGAKNKWNWRKHYFCKNIEKTVTKHDSCKHIVRK